MANSTSLSSDVRTRSAILSAFPWATDFVLQAFETTSNDPSHSRFIQVMYRLEKQLADGTHSVEAMGMQKALVMVSNSDNRFPDASTISKPEARKLCSVLAAYRLMDVLYALQTPPVEYRNPRYAKLPRQGLVPDGRPWSLNDWVSSLKEAHTNLQQLEKFRAGSRPPVGSSTDMVLYSGTEDLTLQATLFKALHGFTKQTKGSNMLFNLQLAAFHLSFMLRGYVANDKLAVPDIPENPDVFHNATIAHAVALTEEERIYQEKFRDAKELHKLRHPLYASLLFSPLYLLAGRKIMNYAWDQSRMVQMSKAIGNDKPDILVRIELHLWRALFNVATGRDTIFTAMETFFAQLPMDELDDVAPADREFFSILGSSPPEHKDIASLLLSVQNETSLSPSWPLSELRTSRPELRRKYYLTEGQGLSSTNSREETPESSQQGTQNDGQNGTEGNYMQMDEDDKNPDNGGPMDQDDMDPDQVDTGTSKGRTRKKPEMAEDTSPEKRKRKGTRASRRVTYVPYQRMGDGSILHPIDVDALKDEMEVTFDPTQNRRRVKGDEFTIVDPMGISHIRQAEFHFPVDLDRFLAFKDLVKSCDADSGLPRYLDGNCQSSVEVIDNAEYLKLSIPQIQEKLRLRHLVITGRPTETVDFDESGLQVLTNLDSKVQFQDQSIPIKDDDMLCQLRVGTLEHILAMARDPEGAIINGLSFPLPLSAIKDPLSSETEAWRLTEGLPFCKSKAVYPTSEMRWGLASTRCARHWTHIDSDGLATFVDVINGEKIWILLKPYLDGEPDPSGHIDVYLEDFHPAQVNPTWEAEAVLLTPGTRLVMKPNTPHAVFTTKHSIVLGGHFYSFSNMQDTLMGIIHCFAVDNIVTNTEHPTTRILLLRMMQYLYKFYVKGGDPCRQQAEHLPVLTSVVSLVDVLALCNFCILANVLDYNTYSFPNLQYGNKATPRQLQLRVQYDYNGLSPLQRKYFTYVRGLALNLINWIACHYEIRPADRDDADADNEPVDFVKNFAGPFLLKQAHTILHYKRRAEEEKILGVRNCREVDVRRQLELLFTDKMNVYGPVQFGELDLSAYDSVSFGTFAWQVSRKPTPIVFEEVDPATLGSTKGDEMFEHGMEKGFVLVRGNAISETKVPTEEDEQAQQQQDLEEEEAEAEESEKEERSRLRKRRRQ